jgi:hypothetical protein
MKLSNKFALISGLVSFATGTPLLLSCIRWTIPLEKQNKNLFFLLFLSLFLTGFFYVYHKNRLQK